MLNQKVSTNTAMTMEEAYCTGCTGVDMSAGHGCVLQGLPSTLLGHALPPNRGCCVIV